MKQKQRDIQFHLPQMMMFKNPSVFNAELKFPFEQFLLFLSFINTFFVKDKEAASILYALAEL